MATRRDPPPDRDLIDRLKHQCLQCDGVQAVGESELQGQFCLKVYFADQRALEDADLSDCRGVTLLLVVSGKVVKQI